MTNEPRIMTDDEVREKFKDFNGDQTGDETICEWFLSLRREEHEAMRRKTREMKSPVILMQDGVSYDFHSVETYNQALDRVLSEVIPRKDE